jgi:hypothetical protein
LVRVSVLTFMMPPRAASAVLPDVVLLVSVSAPMLKIPPPKVLAVLPDTVLPGRQSLAVQVAAVRYRVLWHSSCPLPESTI